MQQKEAFYPVEVIAVIEAYYIELCDSAVRIYF